MKCSICQEEGHKCNNKKFHPGINVVPIKTVEMAAGITREEAEKAATEWLGPSPSKMRVWLVSAIMDTKQHRDIGKVLANVAEIHVVEWLSEKNGLPLKSFTG